MYRYSPAHDLDVSAEWAGFKTRRSSSTGAPAAAVASSTYSPPGMNNNNENNNGGFPRGGGGGGGDAPGGGRNIGRFFKELRQTVVQSTAVATVGLAALFTTQSFFIFQSKHGSLDDTQYIPCQPL